MEDLSDIETDISNERVVHVNSFGKFYEHFLFILKYFNWNVLKLVFFLPMYLS